MQAEMEASLEQTWYQSPASELAAPEIKWQGQTLGDMKPAACWKQGVPTKIQIVIPMQMIH